MPRLTCNVPAHPLRARSTQGKYTLHMSVPRTSDYETALFSLVAEPAGDGGGSASPSTDNNELYDLDLRPCPPVIVLGFT